MSDRVIFGTAKAKLRIGSLDDRNLEVVAQYNPKELQVDKTIPWSKTNQSNKSADKGIALEFTGAEGRSMTVEMLFDGYETGGVMEGPPRKTIADAISDLEKMASVWKPGSKKENERRPHRCVVAWSESKAQDEPTTPSGLPRFDCVIESLSTKYTMFSHDGVPLRATCTVKLKEANVVSAAKAAGAAAPGGGSATPPPAAGGGKP